MTNTAHLMPRHVAFVNDDLGDCLAIGTFADCVDAIRTELLAEALRHGGRRAADIVDPGACIELRRARQYVDRWTGARAEEFDGAGGYWRTEAAGQTYEVRDAAAFDGTELELRAGVTR